MTGSTARYKILIEEPATPKQATMKQPNDALVLGSAAIKPDLMSWSRVLYIAEFGTYAIVRYE
jgi:hypothetical protein